jgi:uridine phosphorylase
MQMQKEIHLTGKDLAGMVQLRPQDIADYVLIPGPMERLQAILKKMKQPMRNFSFMEYMMYTGSFEGMRVTAVNGGRFSADSAIISEIACSAGAKNIIRLGSCGALSPDIKIGDLIVVTGVIRGEGVTPYYVDEKFQTKSDETITKVLVESAKKLGANVHKGLIWTTDALLRETREIVEEKRKKGAIAVDMVCSSMLTIAQLNNVKAGAILAVSDNLITGEMGFINPLYYMSEQRMIDVAFDTIKTLNANDH